MKNSNDYSFINFDKIPKDGRFSPLITEKMGEKTNCNDMNLIKYFINKVEN